MNIIFRYPHHNFTNRFNVVIVVIKCTYYSLFAYYVLGLFWSFGSLLGPILSDFENNFG